MHIAHCTPPKAKNKVPFFFGTSCMMNPWVGSQDNSPIIVFDTPLQCPNHQYLSSLEIFGQLTSTLVMITMINMIIAKIMIAFELWLKRVLVFWNYLMDRILVSSLGFRNSSPGTAKKCYFGKCKLLETFLLFFFAKPNFSA